MLGWITIKDCVELIRKQDPEGRGISRWQLRRRLVKWDAQANGKLLRWRTAPGGVLEVNTAVLLQLMREDPRDREMELAEVNERLAVLDESVRALRARTGKHRKRLDEHEEQLAKK